MTSQQDAVERALVSLRDEFQAPEPDAALEAKLRASFRPNRRIAPLRRWPFLVGAIGLSSAAFAAGGGASWVRSWFYRVEIDGAAATTVGVVEGDGERTIPFTTADGLSGTVRVRRDRLEDGALRTRIDIEGAGDGRVEDEQAEDVLLTREQARLPFSAIEAAIPIFEGVDEEGEEFELFATAGAPSRLLVLRSEPADLPVTQVASVPFDLLAPGSQVVFTERDDGALVISFEDGRGAAFEFVWAPTPIQPAPSELQTQDGSVRVRVENASDMD